MTTKYAFCATYGPEFFSVWCSCARSPARSLSGLLSCGPTSGPGPGPGCPLGLFARLGLGGGSGGANNSGSFLLVCLGGQDTKGTMEDHQRALTVNDDKTKKALLGNEGLVHWGSDGSMSSL